MRSGLLLLACATAFARDARHVTSPNGRIEFRLVVVEPAPGELSRIGYEVYVDGKAALQTSYLGIDVLDQEPILGENAGLISSSNGTDDKHRYNSLTASFMQNGSLGRLLNVEVRAYDDGVAFRYIVPPSTPLLDLLIEDEETEFRFARDPGRGGALPFLIELPDAGPIAITEVRKTDFPEMRLEHSDPTVLVSRLKRKTGDARVAFSGTTPLTCPWRVIAFGYRQDALQQSTILRDLSR
jgi:hypothetical protein